MESTLYENDYALVYATKDVKNNDIVVVGLNENEALVKSYQCYENGDCWLIADNPKYQPLKLEEDHQPYIIGKVIESKKKF